MEKPLIPVAAPMLIGNERSYVMDCIESMWVSSAGMYVERFESKFADFCRVNHAISCVNGTAALHLALLALGVGPGDEVIVPSLTFIATANAVTYCGARPIFVDSELETWNIDPALITTNITPRTKGIIIVHLYGHPTDMDPIVSIARRHGLFIIEDAAEAHGAEYKGQRVGSMSDIATFSFFGNKILTTGEGGMVVTNDDVFARKVRQLGAHGMDPSRRYWFPIVGYNYRMTNVSAAVGLAQLEKVDWHLKRRLEVASWYRDQLQNLREIFWQVEKEWARSVWWMFSIVLNDDVSIRRDELMKLLYSYGIETRPIFYPMHVLPPYCDSSRYNRFPVADRIAKQGLSLPTYAGLTQEEVCYVCDCLKECLRSKKLPPHPLTKGRSSPKLYYTELILADE